MKLKITLVVLIILISSIGYAESSDRHILYFFWGEGCSHCEEGKEFIDKLKKNHPELLVESFEIYNSVKNRDIFMEKAANIGSEAKGVPAFIIDKSIWFGSSKQNNKEIEDMLGILENVGESNYSIRDGIIELPFLGELNPGDMSIILITTIIALIDGFNPCSLWVLIFLLNFIIYSGSRKRVLLIGITFLSVSALTYGLFILGVFTIFSFIQNLLFIRVLLFIFILIFALINIKDYFYINKWFSFTIPGKYKPGLIKKLGKLSRVKGSTVKLILFTAVSSLGITLLELPCTAGFPLLWMNIIQQNNIADSLFFLLLLFYLLIYFIDELFIVLLAYVTLRIKKVTENQGRKLKLISGIIMLYLAIGLLILPDIMNTVSGFIFLVILTILSYLLINVINCKEK